MEHPYTHHKVISTFFDYTRSHSEVAEVKKISEYYYRVDLNNGLNYNVLIHDVYTIGQAEVWNCLNEYPDLNIILSMSAWNSYTPDAKVMALERKIGLFTFRDFLGALHWSNYWEYYYDKDEDGNKLYRYSGVH